LLVDTPERDQSGTGDRREDLHGLVLMSAHIGNGIEPGRELYARDLALSAPIWSSPGVIMACPAIALRSSPA
jgi:hypothetical protein